MKKRMIKMCSVCVPMSHDDCEHYVLKTFTIKTKRICECKDQDALSSIPCEWPPLKEVLCPFPHHPEARGSSQASPPGGQSRTALPPVTLWVTTDTTPHRQENASQHLVYVSQL